MILEFLTAVLYLAILYVLVRPGSPAAGVIKSIFATLVAVVGEATGSAGATSASSGTTSGQVNA